MSFLLPVLRQSFRSSLPRKSRLAVPRTAWRIYPAVSLARYSQNHQPSSKAADDPLQDPLAADSSSTSNTKSSDDSLSGDVPAAPGSILSQYTPQQSRDLDTTEAQSALPKRDEYVSSADRKRDQMAKIFSWGFFLGLIGGGVYLGRPLEEEEQQRVGWGDLPTGHSPQAYWKRFQRRSKFMIALFNEPAFEKLLPPPVPEPYGRPYTLLLDLDDFLIHSEWTREHGWRTAKRPGLDYFLGYLSQYYEIVIFSNKYSTFAAPVVAKLDPYHSSLSGALFRESTRYIDGKVVKDLSFLNRDLSKVVMLDTNPDSYMLQPDNAIPVDKWKGEVGDKGLVALIPLLEYLASQNFKDFRPILKEYKETASRHQITIAEEFARREAMAREALQKTLKPTAEAPSAPPFISKLFGLRTLPPVQLASPQQGEVVMPLDIMRQQAIEGYEAMRKYIEEHGNEILEEDKKREQQMLDESKTSIVGILGRITGRGAASPSEEEKARK